MPNTGEGFLWHSSLVSIAPILKQPGIFQATQEMLRVQVHCLVASREQHWQTCKGVI